MEDVRLWMSGQLVRLDEEECWELLQTIDVGRIAWSESGGPAVLPVNIAVDEGSIWVRTRAHSELSEHTNHRDVSIQADRVDEFTRSGWSVLVRGHARLVAYSLRPPQWPDPMPWPAGARPLLVRIDPAQITGRRLLAA